MVTEAENCLWLSLSTVQVGIKPMTSRSLSDTLSVAQLRHKMYPKLLQDIRRQGTAGSIS